jgi:hypothetical protein
MEGQERVWKYELDRERGWEGGKRKTDQGILKGGSITVPLTSCLTGLESAVGQLTIFVFICKTD